jgi:hypothetical protein
VEFENEVLGTKNLALGIKNLALGTKKLALGTKNNSNAQALIVWKPREVSIPGTAGSRQVL